MATNTQQQNQAGSQSTTSSSSKRFDYVNFSESSMTASNEMRDLMTRLERAISDRLPQDARSTSLALTKLEEAWMWIGKSIRDQQESSTSSSSSSTTRNQ
jgi:hypothetical protein